MRGFIAVLALALALSTQLALPQDAQANTGDRIVRIGKTQLGEPYGHGPNAWTCSEFTRYAIGKATGTWMPAHDNEQRFYG